MLGAMVQYWYDFDARGQAPGIRWGRLPPGLRISLQPCWRRQPPHSLAVRGRGHTSSGIFGGRQASARHAGTRIAPPTSGTMNSLGAGPGSAAGNASSCGALSSTAWIVWPESATSAALSCGIAGATVNWCMPTEEEWQSLAHSRSRSRYPTTFNSSGQRIDAASPQARPTFYAVRRDPGPRGSSPPSSALYQHFVELPPRPGLPRPVPRPAPAASHAVRQARRRPSAVLIRSCATHPLSVRLPYTSSSHLLVLASYGRRSWVSPVQLVVAVGAPGRFRCEPRA